MESMNDCFSIKEAIDRLIEIVIFDYKLSLTSPRGFKDAIEFGQYNSIIL